MSSPSDHMSKMNDNVAANQFPDADLQFDVVEWPYSDFGTSETPPYSHDIYAACSPSLGYPVDLNDIDTALDCDISTLDAYLHSTPPSSSASTVADLPFPNTMQPCSPTLLPSAPEQSPAPPSQQNPVEEFFPDLCEASTSVSAASDSTVRRRNYSSGTVNSSTSRYSPYSVDSTRDDSSEYRMRRDKNNIASQRSRQKRAEKVREMRAEREALERRNIELKAQLTSLETQVADYKQMVLMIVAKAPRP